MVRAAHLLLPYAHERCRPARPSPGSCPLAPRRMPAWPLALHPLMPTSQADAAAGANAAAPTARLVLDDAWPARTTDASRTWDTGYVRDRFRCGFVSVTSLNIKVSCLYSVFCVRSDSRPAETRPRNDTRICAPQGSLGPPPPPFVVPWCSVLCTYEYVSYSITSNVLGAAVASLLPSHVLS